MSASRKTSARRSAIRKWLKACKNATKNVLKGTFNFQCRAPDISLIRDEIPPDNSTEIIKNESSQMQAIPSNNSTTESNISLDDTLQIDGREIDPTKMFASLDVNLLSEARQNLKSTNFKVYPGLVQEKIRFYEKQIAGLDQENHRKDENLKLCKNSLQDRVRFFEGLAKTNSPNVQEECFSETSSESKCKWNSEEDEIHVIVPVKIVPCKASTEPVINPSENLTDHERTVLILIEELHKQCYFMKEANNLVEACLKVKAFQYGKVHLQAEKLLLLACLKRNMLLKRIRKLQFPDENQTSWKSGVIGAEISDLKFSICKDHKNKKASYIVVCSNENDVQVSHIIKEKSDRGFIGIPGVQHFENLDEDCKLDISVYQVNYGNYLSGQRVLQLMNEKNSKPRKKINIQYKDANSGIVVQDQVLESLYKEHTNLEINFSNTRNDEIGKEERRTQNSSGRCCRVIDM
ncbi:hypothetical protein ILUMI_02025 [Ignelater luminosus]|uniref:Uncharacterized protein n=1 Tax=Ignelater luminosus TaxID=2038154 RepID=A0A8K0DH56_IGNLU|nr:hypothetical protein ILUMI_02025 [Ignelater luminosus]